eukprot:GCRY01000179.1.p1 GENE.GCRY01000179.1~~GCRY01000179.1.p1  ORF type:complete len:454 (-),score=108.09 GCRY01000179.1:30-1391(-)
MSRFVRNSKFRHVYAKAPKRENTIENVKLTRSAWDSNFLAAGVSKIAVCWEAGGGGTFAVVPKDHSGKLLPSQPLFTGHTGAVLDLDFNPFNDSIIASGSEDCTAKIWQIPEEMTENVTESLVTLKGHNKKVGEVYFHPCAANVLATSSPDMTVRIWDVETAEEKYQLSGHTDMILSTAWNHDGSLIATTCKDKKLRVFDPRAQSCIAEAPSHAGIKGSRCLWLGASNRFLTVGFTRQSERQMMLWDGTNWDKPLKEEVLDTSSGIIMPFYDDDTKLLYLAGKGDGNIRYYEIVDEAPYWHFIEEYKSSTPQRGMAILPKRAVDVSNNEVVRLYKLTTNAIEPLNFTVPRKSDQFQEDLFPNCVGPEPALTKEEWFSGKNAEVARISLRDGFDPSQHKSTALAVSESAKASNVQEKPMTPAEMEKKIKELEAAVNSRDTKIRQLEAEIAQHKA